MKESYCHSVTMATQNSKSFSFFFSFFIILILCSMPLMYVSDHCFAKLFVLCCFSNACSLTTNHWLFSTGPNINTGILIEIIYLWFLLAFYRDWYSREKSYLTKSLKHISCPLWILLTIALYIIFCIKPVFRIRSPR